jgi:catechol 2,3-dioxygenase-like lactoylglutathione lyase family enzyme
LHLCRDEVSDTFGGDLTGHRRAGHAGREEVSVTFRSDVSRRRHTGRDKVSNTFDRGRGVRLGRRFALLALVVLCGAAPARAARVEEVGCIGNTVSDLDRARDFYVRVLGFRSNGEREEAGPDLEHRTGVFAARTRTARLVLGSECLELTEYLAQKGRPVPADSRSNDRDFQHIAIVVSDMNRAYARLREARVEHASSGPQELPAWNPSAGGIKAFYFRDPDRHVLEVIWFPPGKGAARWHRSGKDLPLTLGIDHTAVVVSDTEASLAFYRDRLGMPEAGHSENHGPEQERLNGVFGARLRITQVRAPKGPGVELLEYLAPRDGRPYPLDARGSDLFHWHVRMVSSEAPALVSALRTARASFVTLPGANAPSSTLLPLRVRDPDGHVLQLETP